MKRLGIEWGLQRMSATQRGELYWLEGRAKIDRVGVYKLPHADGMALVLIQSREFTRYVYRPFEDSKWREEAQTILDLLRAAGGQNISDKIIWEKPHEA